jgi:hypothetical protein
MAATTSGSGEKVQLRLGVCHGAGLITSLYASAKGLSCDRIIGNAGY